MRLLFFVFFVLLSSSANSTSLKIALENADNSPYETLDKNKKLSGFHIELINQALKNSEFIINWYRLPWTRAIESLKSGEVDSVSYLTESEERKKYALFLNDNVLHQSEICLIAKKKTIEKIDINNRDEDLKKFVFLSVDNYEVLPFLATLKGKFKFNNFSSRGENIYSLLQKDRGEISFTEKEIFLKYKKENSDLVKDLEIIPPCYPGIKRYLGFNIRQKEKADKVATLLKKFKQTEDYRLLKKKYQIN